jgi:hypothetical protein
MNAIHITQGSGKLAGIISINTPTSTNPFCQSMQKTDSVCKSCYAQRYEKLRPNIVEAFKRNKFLSERELLPQEIPAINEQIARFASYGELINMMHFINMIRIALANRQTIFTLWTKRPKIVQIVLKLLGKPDNLILIYSCPIVGKVSALPKGFDKVFTAFARGSDMTDINCHGSCNTCRLCYSHNDTTFINEIIK